MVHYQLFCDHIDRMSSSSLFEDITELCRTATNALNDHNPMIHSEFFSLYDSMSAIELMDPKMDQCNGIDVCTRWEDLLRVSLDRPMNEVDVIGVISILLNLEAVYLDGTSHLYSYLS